MIRRVLELAHFHVPSAEIDWAFRPLLDHAAALRSIPRVTWHDWDRYSGRSFSASRRGRGRYAISIFPNPNVAPLPTWRISAVRRR